MDLDCLIGELSPFRREPHDGSPAVLRIRKPLHEPERFNPVEGVPGRAEAALGDALDACAALGLPLADVLPDAVMRWHRTRRGG